MSQMSPRIRLAKSNHSIIDFDLEDSKIILRLGKAAFRLNPECFRDISQSLVKAINELDKFRAEISEPINQEEPSDKDRVEKLLKSEMLSWINPSTRNKNDGTQSR